MSHKTQKFAEILKEAGLSEHEAGVYGTLLELGEAPAQAIIKKTGLKRPTAYYVLGELLQRGLVEEVKGAKKKLFRVTSPENLEKLVNLREADLARAKKVLDFTLPDLVSQYMLALNRPHVVHYEGSSGIKRMHDDMIREKKDILLIQSIYETDDNLEIRRLILENINARVKRSMHTRAIASLVPLSITQIRNGLDEKRLIQRRLIPQEKFSSPAQIIVYGEKVALTTYRGTMLTTIIQNKDIHDTFVAFFEYVWESIKEESETMHQKILSGDIKAP